MLYTKKQISSVYDISNNDLRFLVKNNIIDLVGKKYEIQNFDTLLSPLECCIDGEELRKWSLCLLTKRNTIDSNKIKQNGIFYKKYKNFLDKISLKYDDKLPLSEKLKHFIFDIPLNYCKQCGVLTTKNQEFCSPRCSSSSPQTQTKLQNTNLKRRGVKNPFQDEEVKQKIRETNLNNIDENGLNGYQQQTIKSLETKLNSIDENGLNGFKRQAIKAHKTKIEDIDENGLNCYQRQVISMRETNLNNIDENGLNGYQQQAKKAHKTKIEDIDENGLNTYQRVGKKSQNTREKNGNHQSEKHVLEKAIPNMVKTKMELGYYTKTEDKEDREMYYFLVDNLTNFNFKEFYHFINPENLKRSKEFHLDHIYSRHEGFHNNTPIWIISHPCNLRMLEGKKNVGKSSRCDISLEELLIRINTFDKELK